KGMFYEYSEITGTYLSSVDENEYKFNTIFTNQIQIEIQNKDDLPLKIDSISIQGNIYEIIAKFTENGSFNLVYSNPNADKPQYDIINFMDKVPDKISELTL